MARDHLDVGVIGLGKFGLSIAQTLKKLGHSVVGVDSNDTRIELAQDILNDVYKADATNLSVLRSLHFQEMDYAVVSVGHSVEHSLSITLNLQDLGLNRIWVKASNDEHRKILQRLGVERAILPEVDAAFMTAHQMVHPGMLDLIPKYGGIAIQELVVDKWDGQTLMGLNLMREHTVIVLGIRETGEEDVHFVPSPHTRLNKGDTLVVVGKQTDIAALRS